MRYVPFFDLSVEHSYFVDGRCAMLTIEPTRETWQMARNHRCEIRSRAGGIRVLVGIDAEGKPFLPLGDEAAWRFRLRVEDPSLYLMTDLSVLEGLEAPRYVLPQPPTPDGTLVLQSEPSAYAESGILADVELSGLIWPQPTGTSYRLKIELPVLKARWAYYCLTDLQTVSSPNNAQALTLASVDPETGEAGGIRFREPVDLEKSTAPDPVADALADRHPGLRRLLFLSETLIPCRRLPTEHIELRQGNSRLIGPLPTPSIHRRRVSDAGDEVQLFQVVRYQTNASI